MPLPLSLYTPSHTHTFLSLGWWFVSNGSEEGWAPCSYLENINGGDEEEETISSLGELYLSFRATHTNEGGIVSHIFLLFYYPPEFVTMYILFSI